MKAKLDLKAVRRELINAVTEDCPKGDITSELCVDRSSISTAKVVAKEDMVLSGLEVFAEVMSIVDRGIEVTFKAKDGGKVKAGRTVLTIKGKSISILKAERVALNYLQRMCGVATLTSKIVAQVKGTKAKILDTRKTTPNMRALERYAVTCGGGVNHRYSLSDAVLIKENHIVAAGGITQAIKRVRAGMNGKIIVEVKDKAEVLEALGAKAEILLLDNMKPAQVRSMVKLTKGKALAEVSGGVTIKNVRKYAEAGADRISVGSITHSAPSADLSLLFN